MMIKQATPEQVVAFMTNTMKSTPEQIITLLRAEIERLHGHVAHRDKEIARLDALAVADHAEIERLTNEENEQLGSELEWLRKEFRRFLDVCGEGSSRGRALDLIGRQDWERAVAACRFAEEPKP